MTRDVVVLVATYKRPSTLARLLDHLDGERVIVCDNDPDGSAAAVCGARVGYVHEPRPGIAAARNALLEASSGAELVAFIDDDELPAPGWLDALVATHERTGADVVTGPVLSDFESPPPAWLVPSFERDRQPTGSPVAWPRTGNVLIRRAALEQPRLRFRDAYGLSGGSDSMLFLELARRGATAVWADEAVVHELVPADRASLRWVLRRAFRLGNTHTRFDRDLDGSARRMVLRAAKSAAWVATGLAALLGSIVRADRSRGVAALERLARGTGMAAGLGGFRFVEYARRSP